MNSTPSQIDIDIENQKFAQAFLYMYLFETWEKILDTLSFVNAREHKRSRRNWATINNFSGYLNQLIWQLDISVVPLVLKFANIQKFALDDYLPIINEIKNV